MISKHIEYEKREIITEKQYILLLKSFENFKQQKTVIVNTYYDTEDSTLIPKGFLFRYRSNNNETFEFTLKVKRLLKGNLEYNVSLDSKRYSEQIQYTYISIPEEYRPATKKLNIPNNVLYKKCTLKTTRIEIKVFDYLVVFDKNEYNGIIDHDIEIEAPSMKRATEVMKDLCKTFHIKYHKDCPSKSARALASIKK